MAKRCFFSFHYQDVVDFRANVVRNHNATKDDNGGFFDASIWESSKKQGDLALKRLINGGLNNTSVTVVLIGSQTYSRRWVRPSKTNSVQRTAIRQSLIEGATVSSMATSYQVSRATIIGIRETAD